MGISSRYAMELEEQERSRQAYTPRVRDDAPGFAGQSAWGSAEQSRTIDQESNPDADDDRSPSDDASAQAFGDLYDAILEGTAPADVLDRAQKCAMDCARMTGRPVTQFLTDAARTVASMTICGD